MAKNTFNILVRDDGSDLRIAVSRFDRGRHFDGGSVIDFADCPFVQLGYCRHSLIKLLLYYNESEADAQIFKFVIGMFAVLGAAFILLTIFFL